MTVSAETDRNVIQALAQVARLGQYTLASVSTSDDAQKRVLTVKFVGISSGFVQDTLPYDDLSTPLIAHVNGRSEVERIDGLQPGDLAETEAQADAAIAAAEEIAAAEVLAEITAEQLPQAPGGAEPEGSGDSDEQPRDKDTPFVGELAAAAKQNRKR